MKFHWFHLMPYPELPEDFKEAHRSVWVDVPSSLFDPKVGHRAYNEYLDELGNGPFFPRAKVHVLPESGHWPQVDDPERVAELLVPFLRAQVQT